MSARIVQISASARGGVPKPAVPGAVVTGDGIVGSAVAHPRIHGGPERALCLYSEEHILALQREGHPIRPGSTGENLTLAGLDWAALGPGARLQLGDEVAVEITSYAAPCQQITGSFADGDSRRISQKAHPGWSRLYARVLTPGTLRAGDPVRVLHRPAPAG
jgi:MOSC domain-containing protein YiiM